MTVPAPPAAPVVRHKTPSRQNNLEPETARRVDPKRTQEVKQGEISFSWSPEPEANLLMFWEEDMEVGEDQAAPSSSPTPKSPVLPGLLKCLWLSRKIPQLQGNPSLASRKRHRWQLNVFTKDMNTMETSIKTGIWHRLGRFCSWDNLGRLHLIDND